MSETTAAPAAALTPQFDRAVAAKPATPGGVVCSMCDAKVVEKYYTFGELPVCLRCKNSTEREASKARTVGAFFKAGSYGLGASLAGAVIYYAVLKFLNLEIGLVAIAIGYMVGYSMRKATSGWGARRYQLAAAGLTYFAVGMAYLPFAFESHKDKKAAAAQADSTDTETINPADVDSATLAAATVSNPLITPVIDSSATAVIDSNAVASADSAAASDSAATADSAAAATPAASTKDDDGGPSGLLAGAIGVAAIFLLALSLPIIFIVSSIPGGLISALIIGFGMRQAWRMTAPSGLTFQGPLRVAP